MMNAVANPAVSMTDEEFVLLRDLIHDFCGILLPESMKFLLERRLQSLLALQGKSSFRDYYRLLKYSGYRSAEFDEVVERVATNETYFFRGLAQLRGFTDELLPILLASKEAGDHIRIWSAGCSSGEEPYSIAMLLEGNEAGGEYSFDIFGNDISRKALRQAREATYRTSAFRHMDDSYRERFFTPTGNNRMHLSGTIRNRVTFGHLNLMDEGAMALIANVDVVFCRNVMIYFGPESRARLLHTFFRKMRPGAFLLIGQSESLVKTNSDFELMPLQNDIVYRKPL